MKHSPYYKHRRAEMDILNGKIFPIGKEFVIDCVVAGYYAKIIINKNNDGELRIDNFKYRYYTNSMWSKIDYGISDVLKLMKDKVWKIIKKDIK